MNHPTENIHRAALIAWNKAKAREQEYAAKIRKQIDSLSVMDDRYLALLRRKGEARDVLWTARHALDELMIAGRSLDGPVVDNYRTALLVHRDLADAAPRLADEIRERQCALREMDKEHEPLIAEAKTAELQLNFVRADYEKHLKETACE